uniref:Uncharacterized protein n=1 Tax=Tetranychus urticae TaxID=32264 RepID=A0A158P4W8_TETUR
MLIANLIKIIQLILSIKYSCSFRPFKHNRFTYYKAENNVFDATPSGREKVDSLGIYVAGQTIHTELSLEVINKSELWDAKVVNLNKYRLMFVQKNKPRILIALEVDIDMTYSGELSDSIIAFGDNEALHVPTISNPSLTKPVPEWNYIELLYFDDQNGKVSVKRSLPWLKDDWKFIKEWKMMDYIHFDDKLYLLIKRSIWNEKTTNVTQEIAIIRLCLDKGSELISSAIEIRYNRPEFQNDQITEAIFICVAYYVPEKIFLLITHKTANQTLVHKRYFFNDFVSLFDKTGKECASGANNYTLMRYHLRSEVRSCQKTNYKSCSSNENIVPSVELDFDQILEYHFIFAYGNSTNPPIEFAYNSTINGTHFCWKRVGIREYCMEIHRNFNNDNSIQNVQAFFYGYPTGTFLLSYNNKRYNESRLCVQYEFGLLACYKDDIISMDDYQLRTYFNHRPFGFFRFAKAKGLIAKFLINHCNEYNSCIQCMMYGLNFDCIWSNSMCIDDEKHNVTQTVNYCFKITSFSPSIFDSSSPETLTIQLDRPLKFNASHEILDIKAGPNNHCTDVTPNHNGSIFKCSLHLSESGLFMISVILRNDRYADTISMSALSTEKVYVDVPEFVYLQIIILLFLGLLLISLLLIVYLRCDKEQLKKFRTHTNPKKKRGFFETPSAVTRVLEQILPSYMKTKTNSTFRTKQSSKLVKSGSTMPSVSQKSKIKVKVTAMKESKIKVKLIPTGKRLKKSEGKLSMKKLRND